MVNGVNTVYVDGGHCIFPQQRRVGVREWVSRQVGSQTAAMSWH